MICELLFPSSILAVKMNRKTLVIVLEAEIYIYDISNMRLQHVIETTPNPEAIVALSPSADNSYLAYPSPVPPPAPIAAVSPQAAPAQPSSPSAASGDVLLFSTKSLTVSQIIRAHKAPISALALNSTGTLLATASEKGTVIRVWGVPGAEKLYQFRRGTREARIYSLNFNVVSTLLAVSSAHDTVHIFKLGSARGANNNNNNNNNSSSSSSNNNNNNTSSSGREDHATSPSGSVDSREGAGALEGGYDAFVDDKKKKSGGMSSSLRRRSLHLTKNITSSVGGYLPNTLTEMWEPSRDFAFLKLPTSGARCIVALSGCVAELICAVSCGAPLTLRL
jgi:autophagy-related protein 18